MSALPGGEHDVLNIAATMRQLLLDGLMHDANRTQRLGIHFTLNDLKPESGIPHWDPTSVLDPGTSRIAGGTVDLTLDQFLARKVLVIEGTPISVKQLITFFANVEGGVHWSGSPTGDDALLRLWRPAGKLTSANGEQRTSMAHVLASLARIVVTALTPLRQTVRATLPSESRIRLAGSPV